MQVCQLFEIRSRAQLEQTITVFEFPKWIFFTAKSAPGWNGEYTPGNMAHSYGIASVLGNSFQFLPKRWIPPIIVVLLGLWNPSDFWIRGSFLPTENPPILWAKTESTWVIPMGFMIHGRWIRDWLVWIPTFVRASKKGRKKNWCFIFT